MGFNFDSKVFASENKMYECQNCYLKCMFKIDAWNMKNFSALFYEV